jgi:uncharacterized protein YndB with AHSA1/START domain
MTSLTLVRRIAARPSIVFQALISPDGISHWWGPDEGPVLVAEVDARVGGRFRVRFRMADGSEHESRGEFLEVVHPSRLAFTWCWVGREAEGESRVEIDVHSTSEGSELVFKHSRLVDEETRRGHEQGWNGSLDKLVNYLAGPGRFM